ncbi:outer membrane protein assembly factor BamB family protein [Micromonospora psammae]|uniref:outer membrane protein assembly factor BamB family protein n=1 Tax=Micromonospora sp. CPCC 205556 TaxID=3122398 RepID=UPI002FF04A74
MTVIDLGERSHDTEPDPPPPPPPVGRQLRAALVALLTLLALGAAAPAPARAVRIPVPATSQPGSLVAAGLLILVGERVAGPDGPPQLIAVDVTDGRSRWRLPLPDAAPVSVLERLGDDVVVTVESDEGPTTLLIDPTAGRVRWRRAGTATPTGDGGLLLSAAGPGAVHGVDPGSGAVRWSVASGADTVQYRYDARTVDAFVLVAVTGRIQVYDASTGERRAAFTIPPPRPGGYESTQVVGDLLLVVGEPDRVAAYGLDDGALRWEAPLDPTAPITNDCGDAICLGQPSRARVIDPATGRVRWTADGWAPLTLVGDRLLAGGPEGARQQYALLDPATGRVLAELGRWQPVGELRGKRLLVTRLLPRNRQLLAELELATGEVRVRHVLPGWSGSCDYADRVLHCLTEGGQIRAWRLPG